MARGSMKTAANCVSKCELQDTLSIDRLNAHCVHGHRAVGTLGRGWVQIKNRTSAVHRNGGRAPRVLAVPAWESRCVSNRSSSSSSVMGGGLGIKTARSAGTYLVASELQRLGLNDRDPKLLASSIQECRPSAVAQSKSFFSMSNHHSTSPRERLPAKFKHINKRWKRNQQGFP